MRKPDSSLAKHIYKLNRLDLGRLLRLISGHNGLLYFHSLLNNEINPNCRFCNEERETFHHLVSNCPCFISERAEIFKKHLNAAEEDWNVKDLLTFSKIEKISDAIEGGNTYGAETDDSSSSGSFPLEPD